jgi:hypothetical protein
VATPWGTALLVDEVRVRQRADEREFTSLVQLLDSPAGRLVRFAYTTEGAARRGPVTLRAADVRRLRKALAGHAELAEILGLGGGEAGETV